MSTGFHFATTSMTILVLLLVVLGIVFSFYFSSLKKKERERVLKELAMGLRGARVKASNWLSESELSFEVAGHQGCLTFYSTEGKYSKDWTQLTFEFKEKAPFTLEIHPEDVGAKVAKLFGGQDIQIGDVVFDGAFRLQSSDELRLKEFLSEEVKQAIFRVSRLGRGNEIKVEVSEEEFGLHKLHWLTKKGDLLDYIEDGKILFERYLEVTSS